MLIASVEDKVTDTSDLTTEGNGGTSTPETDGDGYDSDASLVQNTRT